MKQVTDIINNLTNRNCFEDYKDLNEFKRLAVLHARISNLGLPFPPKDNFNQQSISNFGFFSNGLAVRKICSEQGVKYYRDVDEAYYYYIASNLSGLLSTIRPDKYYSKSTEADSARDTLTAAFKYADQSSIECLLAQYSTDLTLSKELMRSIFQLSSDIENSSEQYQLKLAAVDVNMLERLEITDEWDIFLSFAGLESRAVAWILHQDIRMNYRVFFDVRQIDTSSSINDQCIDAIRKSKLVVVLFTKPYFDSGRFTVQELSAIVASKRQIFPIILLYSDTKEQREQELIDIKELLRPSFPVIADSLEIDRMEDKGCFEALRSCVDQPMFVDHYKCRPKSKVYLYTIEIGFMADKLLADVRKCEPDVANTSEEADMWVIVLDCDECQQPLEANKLERLTEICNQADKQNKCWFFVFLGEHNHPCTSQIYRNDSFGLFSKRAVIYADFCDFSLPQSVRLNHCTQMISLLSGHTFKFEPTYNITISVFPTAVMYLKNPITW